MFLSKLFSPTKVARGSIPFKIMMGVSAICIMVAFIISTVITTSGKQPGTKNFYLVSFEYNTPSNNSATKAVSSFLGAVDDLLDSDKNKTSSFTSVRVGFSGVCVHQSSGDNKAESWTCGTAEATNKLGEDANGDPFDLIEIAAFYKDKIAFSLPWWIATVSLGLGFLLITVNCIPLISIPPIVTKLAAGFALLGTLSLLGGLVLMLVTTNAVVTLATRLTMKTVQAHPGTANQAFGWAAFALATIATILVGIMVIVDMACQKIEQYQGRVVDKANEKLGERIPSPVRSGFSSFSSSQKSYTGRTLNLASSIAAPVAARVGTSVGSRAATLHHIVGQGDRKKGGDNMV